MSSLKIRLAAAAFIAIPGAAGAADLGAILPPVFTPQSAPEMVEFGTGWYLRGDIAWSRDKTPSIVSDPAVIRNSTPGLAIPATFGSSNKSENGYMAGIGAGYQFNSWLRADATLDYRKGANLAGAFAAGTCPYALSAYTPAGSTTATGYSFESGQSCTGDLHVRQNRTTALINGYVDLGNWSGVTPYLGAGAGLSNVVTTGSMNYVRNSDGGAYRANLTATGSTPQVWIDPSTGRQVATNIAFGPQNWDRTVKSKTTRFAWALMAGVAIDVSQHVKLDIGYRYLDLGSYNVYVNTTSGQTIAQRSTSQEVRVGVRYMID